MRKNESLRKASLSSTPLWNHQRKAVGAIRKYLSAAKDNKVNGAALIHMPTGTGKTGVIACSSHFLKDLHCVLILSPRIALRDQLAREVGSRFFEKLDLDARSLPKKVINVRDEFPNIVPDEYAGKIFVMTIQMLYSMAKRKKENYEELGTNVDLVIVDEGHYEPAISWREAIRAVKKPKVIFTATPFRNDLKLFDIDYKHAFSYTFDEAVEEKIIRSVIIYPRIHPGTPQDFVNEVSEFYNNHLVQGENGEEPRPRVIIRCEYQATIRQIGAALELLGKSYVLIHENFEDNGPQPYERRTVPDPSEEDAIYWVHQFKLLEGIDDSRFQLLALYQELRTTRQFVQQVGRVIRNPSRELDAVAHVLDHSNGLQKELWDGFIAFDLLLRKEGVEVADFGDKLLDELVKAQPGVVYLDGRFRIPFSLSDIDPAEELSLPLTVNIFRKDAEFNLARLCDEIDSEYAEQDRAFRRVSVNPTTEIFLYLVFYNSPLLRSTCFIECRLGVTIVREVDKYLCYSDSSGRVPVVLDGYAEQLRVEELRRLFKQGQGTYLTAVSLRNANLGPSAVRSRAISAARIPDTVPAFDDHAFVCRTVQGRCDEDDKNVVRRYVGFQRGKITDSSKGRVSFHDYMEWLDAIAQVLSDKSNVIAEFERYGKPSNIPADPEPVSILLDLAEVQDLFFTNAWNGIKADQIMCIKDVCAEIHNCLFSVTANGKECKVKIHFNQDTGRYKLSSMDLDTLYYSKDENLASGVIRYLNQTQSFRVIPKSEGSFYTLGEFYSPVLRFGERFNDEQFGLLHVIHPAQCLVKIGSEKGNECAQDGSCWHSNSLFGIIDKKGSGHGLTRLFGRPDILVCDDMGTEAADFILGNTKERRVIFIHAKGNTGDIRKYAASPLQEVCGQATKNLKYLSRYGQDEPSKARKWHTSKWKAKGVLGEVKSRIREKPDGISTGLQLWKEIKTIIRDPIADLQVWLFLGRLFSRAAFEEQLTAVRPATEAKQAAYLLFSTMNDVASIGATLKVICSP